MPSVFISYGSPDEDFAKKLFISLKSMGVDTFYFPESSVPGEKLHNVMRNGVNKYKKVILICSEKSLNRNGVLNEIEEVLQREAREGGESILIPIKIDDYVLSRWSPQRSGLALSIRDRVIADFSKAVNDNKEFDKQISKIYQAIVSKNKLLFNFYSVLVTVLDDIGKEAIYKITKTMTVNCPSIKTVTFDDLFSDGSMVIEKCIGGDIIEQTDKGGVRLVYIDLGKEYSRGEEVRLSLIMRVKDSFLGKKEYISHQVSSSYSNMQLKVDTVIGRPIMVAYAKVIYEQSENPIRVDISENRLSAEVNINSPKQGGLYCLDWEW